MRVLLGMVFFSVLSNGLNGGLKRYTKVTCRTSGKSIENMDCNIKAYSRNLTVLNFKFDVTRELNKMTVKYEVYFKYLSNNWRQLLKINGVDVCSLLNFSLKTVGIATVANNIFKNIEGGKPPPHCPWHIGFKFRMTNYTEEDIIQSFQSFPSGDYKQVLTMLNDEDDLILEAATFSSTRAGGNYEF